MGPAQQAPAQLQQVLPLECKVSALLAAEPAKVSLADGVADVRAVPWSGTAKASSYQRAVLMRRAVRQGCQKRAPVSRQGGQGGNGARLQGDGAAGGAHRKLPAAAMHGLAMPPLQQAIDCNSD